MELVFLIGRILFGLIFVGSGIGHFAGVDDSTAYAESKGVSSARNMVMLSGALMLLGGIGVILGVWLDLVGYCIAALMLVFNFMMHKFWEESDEQTKTVEMSMFMKNLSIAGGALILTATADADWYTLTDKLF